MNGIYGKYPSSLYMGLHKPSKRMEFDQPCLSEKVTCSF